MPLGQGFLNSWLKVNSKSIVIPNKNDKEGKIDAAKQATRLDVRKSTPDTVTERTAQSEEEQSQTRRLNNRKSKKRLNRTVSASDLIRDKISGKGSKKSDQSSTGTPTNSIFSSSRSQYQRSIRDGVGDHVSYGTPPNSIVGSHRSQYQKSIKDGVVEDGVVDFVPTGTPPNSIFGSNRSQLSKPIKGGVVDHDFGSRASTGSPPTSTIGTNRTQCKTPQQGSKTSTGSPSSQSQRLQQQQQDESSLPLPKKPIHPEYIPGGAGAGAGALQTNGSLRFVAGFFGADIDTLSSGGNDFENPSVKSGPNRQQHHDSVSVKSLPSRIKSKARGGGMGLRFPPNIFALDSISGDKCQQCSKLEDELTLAREDVEYLRGVALRNEYMYASIQQGDKQLEASNRSNSNRSSSLESSTREIEIQEMKKEWATMEQQMQQEIQKYSDFCVKLNEEAEFRTEEALNLHVELNSVSRERDEMATEVEFLRAQVTEFEKRDKERRKAEKILEQYEEHGVAFATREIGARDVIIEDLSKRLEFALDTLSIERQKQNQRRQIIFPNQRNQDNSSDEALEQELKETKDALRRAEDTIEFLRKQNNGSMERE